MLATLARTPTGNGGDGGVLESALRTCGDCTGQTDRRSVRAEGVEAESFNAALLHEPWTIQNQSGKPFQGLHPVLEALPDEARSG